MVSKSKVLEALRRHADGFRRAHGCDPVRARVLERLGACRTGALGGHLLVCHDCELRLPVYTSCDDRHCPQCGGARTAKWLEARAERMLDVPHFQVVFTLPEELRAVAHRNPAVVYPLMFRVGASVLADLAAQKLGARLGITSVLHTWASNLSLHPHVHCLVTAGGLSLDGQRWVETRRDFLFHVGVLGRMYRGRLLEGLIDARDSGALDLGDEADTFDNTLRRLARRHHKWVVHVEAPGDRPVLHALKYLARYMFRVAISDRRIVEITDTHVRFWARDADSGGRQRPLRVSGPEFVRRFLLHVLPRGLRKVRHYGLYAPGNAKIRLCRARLLLPKRDLGVPTDLEAEIALSKLDRLFAIRAVLERRCPSCGAHMARHPLPRPAGAVAARGPP